MRFWEGTVFAHDWARHRLAGSSRSRRMAWYWGELLACNQVRTAEEVYPVIMKDVSMSGLRSRYHFLGWYWNEQTLSRGCSKWLMECRQGVVCNANADVFLSCWQFGGIATTNHQQNFTFQKDNSPRLIDLSWSKHQIDFDLHPTSFVLYRSRWMFNIKHSSKGATADDVLRPWYIDLTSSIDPFQTRASLNIPITPTMSPNDSSAMEKLIQARNAALQNVTLYPQVMEPILGLVTTSPTLDLQRWVANFVAEALASPSLVSEEKQKMALPLLPVLKSFLELPGEDVIILKSTIQACASLYPLIFRHM